MRQRVDKHSKLAVFLVHRQKVIGVMEIAGVGKRRKGTVEIEGSGWSRPMTWLGILVCIQASRA